MIWHDLISLIQPASRYLKSKGRRRNLKISLEKSLIWPILIISQTDDSIITNLVQEHAIQRLQRNSFQSNAPKTSHSIHSPKPKSHTSSTLQQTHKICIHMSIWIPNYANQQAKYSPFPQQHFIINTKFNCNILPHQYEHVQHFPIKNDKKIVEMFFSPSTLCCIDHRERIKIHKVFIKHFCTLNAQIV